MDAKIYKSYIPVLIMFSIGFILTTQYFIQVPDYVTTLANDIKNVSMVIAAFALGVGAINIVIVHGNRIRKRVAGEWYFSIWLLVLWIVYLVVGLTLSTTSYEYNLLFNTFYVPINQTMYALLGYYVVYASYRSLKARNYQALVMIIVACFTIIGSAPIGQTIWQGFKDIQNWLLTVPNAGAERGIVIITAIGGILLGIRTLLGMEKGSIGGEVSE